MTWIEIVKIFVQFLLVPIVVFGSVLVTVLIFDWLKINLYKRKMIRLISKEGLINS